jgi:alkylated DNA nucleotide flippase Atl1
MPLDPASELDGHLAVVPLVVREVDGRHSAGANLALDAVAAGEGRRQSRDCMHAMFRSTRPPCLRVIRVQGSASSRPYLRQDGAADGVTRQISPVSVAT